jgi:hypothetical protein
LFRPSIFIRRCVHACICPLLLSGAALTPTFRRISGVATLRPANQQWRPAANALTPSSNIINSRADRGIRNSGGLARVGEDGDNDDDDDDDDEDDDDDDDDDEDEDVA